MKVTGDLTDCPIDYCSHGGHCTEDETCGPLTIENIWSVSETDDQICSIFFFAHFTNENQNKMTTQ